MRTASRAMVKHLFFFFYCYRLTGNNRTTPSNSPPPGAKEHEEQLKQRHQSGSDNNKTHTTVAPSKPIPATPLKLMRLGRLVCRVSNQTLLHRVLFCQVYKLFRENFANVILHFAFKIITENIQKSYMAFL